MVFVLRGALLGLEYVSCGDIADLVLMFGQALLAILDSPMNKAGKLKGLYVHTEKNVLIQINPHIRIPRTFKRFCGLMGQ